MDADGTEEVQRRSIQAPQIEFRASGIAGVASNFH